MLCNFWHETESGVCELGCPVAMLVPVDPGEDLPPADV